MTHDDQGSVHAFGGDWTQRKLAVLQRYLSAYTTALRCQPFELWYVDAFAGTGTRVAHDVRSGSPPASEPDEPRALLDGSARLALRTSPPFDRFLFIERNTRHVAALKALSESARRSPGSVLVQHGDANELLVALAREDWRRRRGVLFLDPYGMQLDWATLEAIADTRALDVWLLVPIGMGLVRLLPRDGAVPEPWRRRMDRFLGTNSWYDAFYRTQRSPTLFDPGATELERARPAALAEFVQARLRLLFPGVAQLPGVLRNSRNNPLYVLCFAAANPRGARIAVRIAEHLLKELETWPEDRGSSGRRPRGTP